MRRQITRLGILLSALTAIAAHASGPDAKRTMSQFLKQRKFELQAPSCPAPGPSPSERNCLNAICSSAINSAPGQHALQLDPAQLNAFLSSPQAAQARTAYLKIAGFNADTFEFTLNNMVKNLDQLEQLSPDEHVLQSLIWLVAVSRGAPWPAPNFTNREALGKALASDYSDVTTLDEYYREKSPEVPVAITFKNDLADLEARYRGLSKNFKRVLILPSDEEFLQDVFRTKKPPQDERRFLKARHAVMLGSKLETDAEVRKVLQSDRLFPSKKPAGGTVSIETDLDALLREMDPEHARKNLSKSLKEILLYTQKRFAGEKSQLKAELAEACLAKTWETQAMALPEKATKQLETEKEQVRSSFITHLRGIVSKESGGKVDADFRRIRIHLPPSRETLTQRMADALDKQLASAEEAFKIKLTEKEQLQQAKINLAMVPLVPFMVSPCNELLEEDGDFSAVDSYNSRNTDVKLSSWNLRGNNWQAVLRHELGHRLSAISPSLSEGTRGLMKKSQECLASMHRNVVAPPVDDSAYLADENFADAVSIAMGAKTEPNSFCAIANLMNASIENWEPQMTRENPRDTHASVLFRILHAEQNLRGALPAQCQGLNSGLNSCFPPK